MNKKRKHKDNLLKALVYGAVGITITLLVGIILYIFIKGVPFITWELISTSPDHITKTIGILPNILNTLYIILLTLLLSLPIGIGAAIYLNEYATNKIFLKIIQTAVEALAGIPSIIYGLVGMLFFVEFLGLKLSLISGCLTLFIMILPTIIRTTQETLKTVPEMYREGALGLGATKWYMIRTIILPCSLNGIVTSCILSIGRIVGESAALLFTAGLSIGVVKNIFEVYTSSGASLSVSLYMYVSERGEFEIGFAIASILMMLVFILNLATKFVQKKLKIKL